MAKTAPQSPALQLFNLVREHEGHSMGRSRERYQHAKQAAIRLAIEYGLRFDREDFEKLLKETRSYYGPVYAPSEQDYALACGSERGVNNPSAAQSIEHALKRKPFLIRDPSEKTATRIYGGRRFRWYPGDVTCTSFADDQSYLTACTYKQVDHDPPDGLVAGAFLSVEGYHEKLRRIEMVAEDGRLLTLSERVYEHDEVYGRDVARRFKIDHQAIKEFHAACKRWADVQPRIRQVPKGRWDEVITPLVKKLSLTRDAVPNAEQLDVIEAAVAPFAGEVSRA